MDEPTQIGKLLPTAGQWAAPKPPPAPPLSWQAPATREEIILALSPCLTIAAPSGMSLDDRTEWFMAAAGFLESVPAGLLKEAARRTVCDHPSKIVPAILAYAAQNMDTFVYRNRPATTAPRLEVVKPEKPKAPKITQGEIDKMPPAMIELGVSCGALVRDDDGKVSAA